jgi:alginate O-acetyltransferase complex protein AlgI
MLFNSFEFIFLFLPLLLMALYSVRRYFPGGAHVLLIAASVVFYALLDAHHLWVLAGSALVNFRIGNRLSASVAETGYSRWWLLAGIVFNLSLLGGYKYIGFAAQLAGWDFSSVAAPLGISFFTFHQLAYLIDIHRRRIVPTGMRDYLLYVTFFPHLIAGPIMRYAQFAPQLSHPKHSIAYGAGIFFFSVGLFKKSVLADTFAPVADRLFAAAAAGQVPGFWEAWKGALAYGWQIYFDFSGYADMAIGLGLLLGIALPVNFDSPYKSVSIIDFWRRWHITLSQFLRDYVYIPLGGSRRGKSTQMFALLLTMSLAGLWHGAALTFVVWGALHGALLAGVHVWRSSMGRYLRIPASMSVALTFVAVLLLWVLFRAENFGSALAYYRSMATFVPIVPPGEWSLWFTDPAWREWLWIMAGGVVVFVLKPTARHVKYDHEHSFSDRLQATGYHAVVSGILLWMSFKAMSGEPSRSFVYFVF